MDPGVPSLFSTKRPAGQLKFALAALALWVMAAPLALRAAQPTLTQPTAGSAPDISSFPITTNANLFTSIESLDDKQKLGVGDRISFRVIEDKEEAKSLVVTDSGELDIPYLGRLRVLDKTCQSVAREAKVALEKELYYKATVILAIDQLNRKRGSVYLVGQVKASGPVEIPSDEVFTLSKAILRAGGFGDFADKRRVKITRQPSVPGGQNKVFTVDVSEILEKGQTDKDLKLETGDLIFVPSRLINF